MQTPKTNLNPDQDGLISGHRSQYGHRLLMTYIYHIVRLDYASPSLNRKVQFVAALHQHLPCFGHVSFAVRWILSQLDN
jgi:hypothetical protein